MVLWAILCIYWIVNLLIKKDTASVNTYLYDSIPTVFTSLGVLGTFIGIYIGLREFETTDIDGSIEELLNGLKAAFITSIVGIMGALLFGRIAEGVYGIVEAQGPKRSTDELSALQELVLLTRDGKKESNDNLLQLNDSLIGESNDSVATQLIIIQNKFSNLESIQGQQADATYAIQNSIGGNDETSLISQVQRMRAEQKNASDQMARSITTVVDTMSNNSNLLTEKFDEFADLLAKNNTDALVDVMKSATEEFNKQMTAIVEKLVQENFKQLNDSVERMNTWQQENKEMIIQLTAQFGQVSSDLGRSATHVKEIAVNTESLTNSNSVLAQLITQLKAVMIDDVRFKEVSTKLLDTADLVKSNTEAFDLTTNKLNDWIQKEHNFRDSITALIARLEDFQKIKGYNEEF